MSPDVPFRYLLRVRYGECDPQKIVFNARYGDYTDLATTEYQRALWGVIDGPDALDVRLVRQVTEWRSPARFDDVVAVDVTTRAIGTTSFTLGCELRRWPDGPVLATTETVYVAVDAEAGVKRPVPDGHRRALERGAPGVIVDHAGVGR